MKILQVVHNIPYGSGGGTEIYTYHLSRELRKKHEVSVFCRINEPDKPEYNISSNNHEGLQIFTINNNFRFCDSFRMFYRNDHIDAKFGELLDIIKPGIVHIQHLIFLSSSMVFEAKKRGIPVVYTIHDYWLLCPQWHFLKTDNSLCDGDRDEECVGCVFDQLMVSKASKDTYNFLKRMLSAEVLGFLKTCYLRSAALFKKSGNKREEVRLRREYLKKLFEAVDLFIVPSNFLKLKFADFGIPERKIRLIPNGIDRSGFENFKRKESKIIRFAFIGTILPAKGLDVLIRAFASIESKGAQLKIFGLLRAYRGFEKYPDYVRDLAKKDPRIKFFGNFANEDTPDVFSEIDVLVVPSVWLENCPLVIQEALSADTPIIASNIGGIPEFIKDGINGLLFRPSDADDLRAKMQLLIDSPQTIDALRRNIRKPTGIEGNAVSIENIYLDLTAALKS